jgi:glycosyltransferase involved in cell wall biosynthesis
MSTLPATVGTAARPAAAIGLWHTDPGLTTGQSVVTDHVDALLGRGGAQRYVLLAGGGPRALARWAGAIGRLALSVLRGRLRTLYLVCSRSRVGFLRDVPAYLAQRAGVRVVVHAHGSDIVDLVSRPLARRLLLGCELVVPSTHLREPLAAAGVRNVHVCENFVAWAPPAAPAAAGGTPFTVLWNSNVIASKGFFDVAAAVAQLHARGTALRLVALGAPLGDETLAQDACAARLAGLRGEPWLDWRGPQPRDAVRRALAEADLVALPSHYASECQPLALLEAMCAARAILIADTAPLRATLGDYPCTVVARVDTDSVAAALQRCIAAAGQDNAKREAAADRARERFSAARFDQQMRRLLGLPPSS